MAQFFSVIPYRDVDGATWDLAKTWSWKLRDGGFTIPWNDILTGALAHQHDLRVFARDAHFDLLKERCGVRLYEPGYGGSFNPS